jgi:hypothetical protein
MTAIAPLAPGEVANATIVSAETEPIDMSQRYIKVYALCRFGVYSDAVKNFMLQILFYYKKR